MKYYIFKFTKKRFDSNWMVGVCGGYEGDSLEHCGHVFSNFNEYNVATEKQDAIDMIEMIREYWMQRAKEFENQQ